jgi:hypothetical protein
MPRSLYVALLALALPAAGLAQTPDREADVDPAFTPQSLPTLEVSRAAGAIEVDGELDDAGWQGAARATGWMEYFPTEGARPPVESEAWVTYDDEKLYFAFVAYDDPATLRTSLRDRDQAFRDDFIGIMLDTYGDAAWAYELYVNPSGVQMDLRMTSDGNEDAGFDLVWDAETKITERGWQVEIAVPFKSLRFPDRPEHIWRANFWRTRPRESRAQHSWAALSRDEECFFCQWGTLTGIRGVQPGGALELLPAVVASHSASLADPEDPDSGLDDTEFDGDAGLTARYSHASGITIEGTLNPDFSQVESDVAQIDVNTTFALFFPERRPFFQEGSELFDSFFTVVYTRQINDPLVAAKSVIRKGRTAYAYLGAYDEHSPILLPFQERSFVGLGEASYSNIGRVRQTYGEGSYVGAILADRRFEDGGGSGTNFGLDGTHRFLEKYRFEYQLVGSHTAEPDEAGATSQLGDLTFNDGEHTAVFDGESFSGWGAYASLERSSRFWSFDHDYWTSSPTFRADDGFETRNDFQRFVAFHELAWYPETSWIDQFVVDARFSRDWTHDGERKSGFFTPTIEMQLPLQTFFEVGPIWDFERFRGIDFDDQFSWFVFLRATPVERVTAGFYYETGDEIAKNLAVPALGDASYLEIFGTLKPLDRLTVEPTLVRSRLDVDGEEVFDGYIFRARTIFNLTRQLYARIVVQYDDFDEAFSLEPLVTYQINPFTLFYVGSTNAFNRFEAQDTFAQTSRQFFLKFQYLYQP